MQWDGRTDASVLPATAIQELTFTRGLSSMLYGPNVLGGVVEVGVGHGDLRPPHTMLTLSAGTDDLGGYGTAGSMTVPVTTESGSWLVRAGVGYRDSPGQPLAEGIEEPVPADDESLRLNTDVNHRDGFFAVRYNAGSGPWFSLSGSGFRAERGIAAELGTTGPRLWRYPRVTRTIAVLSGGSGDRDTFLGGRGDVEASVGLDVGRTDIDAFTDRRYDQVESFEDGEDRTVTARMLADHTLGTRADLRAAFTYGDIFHREILPGGTLEYEQRLWSLGTETVLRLVERPGTAIRLSLGGAIDGSSWPKTGDKPALDGKTNWGARAGLTATVNGGNTLLHAGASRRGRFPALRETFSGALNRFEPNPELQAEFLTAFEGGVTTRLAGAEFQTIVFHHRLNDAIVRIQQPDRRFKRVNRDQMRSTGLELLASRSFGALSLGGDLTMQTVDLIDGSTNEKREPENQPSTFGSVTARFPLVLGVHAGTSAQFTSSNFCLDLETGEDLRLAGGTQLNADVSRVWQIMTRSGSWVSRLEARIAVDNAGDTAIYDQCGLPQPGRLFRFEVRLF
jgi:iron complex outermembrane receptor protein